MAHEVSIQPVTCFVVGVKINAMVLKSFSQIGIHQFFFQNLVSSRIKQITIFVKSKFQESHAHDVMIEKDERIGTARKNIT